MYFCTVHMHYRPWTAGGWFKCLFCCKYRIILFRGAPFSSARQKILTWKSLLIFKVRTISLKGSLRRQTAPAQTWESFGYYFATGRRRGAGNRNTCANEKGQTRLLRFPGRVVSQNLLNLKRNLTAASNFDCKLCDFFFSSWKLYLLGCIIKSLKRKPCTSEQSVLLAFQIS